MFCWSELLCFFAILTLANATKYIAVCFITNTLSNLNPKKPRKSISKP